MAKIVKKTSKQQSILDINTKSETKRDETLRFIHGIGHELKQPLGLIRAYSYYIKKNLTPAQSVLLQYPEKIDQQVDLITEMLNNVVDATKASTSTLTLHKELITISEFLDKTQAAIKKLFPTRKIIFLRDNCISQFLVDHVRLQQAISNVVTNAVKYSPESALVTITSNCTSSHLILEIKDAGIGIPEEDLKNIFDPYYRASNSKSTGVKGLGLGLTLANEIIDLHEGEIKIVSSVNDGTLATIRLPFKV